MLVYLIASNDTIIMHKYSATNNTESWHLTCGQVCAVPCADGRNTVPIFGWTIAMVVVVGGGVGAVLVVVMVEDAWRAAHPSSPPAPRYPILICHPLILSPLLTLPTTFSHVSQHGNKFTYIIHRQGNI